MSSRDIDVGGSNSQKQQPCEILVGQKSKKDAASMICAIPISKPSPFHASTERCVDSFLPGDWVEDATVDQNARFGSMLSSVNADLQSNGGVNNDFIIFQPVSHACSVDMTKKIPCFASENMSKNESSLDVSKCFSSRNNVHHFTQDGILGSDYGFKRNEKSAHIQQSWQVSKTQNEGPSSEEKKQKRTSNLSNFQQEVGSQKQHDIIEGGKALDEKKQRIDKVVTTTHGLIDKDSKDHSGHADNPKEDYVHIRVKRGQATNNHSLAERARRERISERMRFLQDLVPGCNKITGKAVMLDEIINYVQSLQRQVEFLSMKLATVNPELNFDVEEILSKDIHSINNVCESTFLKVVTGNNTCYANAYDSSNGFVQSESVMPDVHSSRVAPESTDPMFYSMSQASRVWSDELQSIVQMGFTPTTVNNLDQQVCKRLRHDNSEIIHMQ